MQDDGIRANLRYTQQAFVATVMKVCNFEREKLKIELGLGQIWNQHIRIVWKHVHDKEMPYKL